MTDLVFDVINQDVPQAFFMNFFLIVNFISFFSSIGNLFWNSYRYMFISYGVMLFVY